MAATYPAPPPHLLLHARHAAAGAAARARRRRRRLAALVAAQVREARHDELCSLRLARAALARHLRASDNVSFVGSLVPEERCER